MLLPLHFLIQACHLLLTPWPLLTLLDLNDLGVHSSMILSIGDPGLAPPSIVIDVFDHGLHGSLAPKVRMIWVSVSSVQYFCCCCIFCSCKRQRQQQRQQRQQQQLDSDFDKRESALKTRTKSNMKGLVTWPQSSVSLWKLAFDDAKPKKAKGHPCKTKCTYEHVHRCLN